ncbi:hypothetical protein [Novipirellula artificiosorum]|uniref:Uncharacterized protein n=1 Tax=Novipirellula artificiosorum TaxID=2528016 RepID=A0A5C6D7S0_9BACT|nr:hypothetical protein [Novipirellula artificiosorum]TWU32982.1 hypothetical protein Poly41_53610 [Novipirellula artificiosorum]
MRSSSPKGSFLIAAMVCLLVSTSLAVAAVRSARVAQRELQMRKQMLQTEWLLDAAVHRAVRRMEQSPEYRGETWIATELTERWPIAEAEIVVDPTETSEDYRVHVTARLSAASDDRFTPQASRTQRSHTFTLSASPKLESSKDAKSE